MWDGENVIIIKEALDALMGMKVLNPQELMRFIPGCNERQRKRLLELCIRTKAAVI